MGEAEGGFAALALAPGAFAAADTGTVAESSATVGPTKLCCDRLFLPDQWILDGIIAPAESDESLELPAVEGGRCCDKGPTL